MKILFLDGTAKYSPTRVKTKPCGGILTSLTKIPEYLASKGLEVYVVSTFQKTELVNGVHHIQDLSSINPDIVVYNRNLINKHLTGFYPKAKKIWWLHDIVDHRYLEDSAFMGVDKIVSLSDYCTKSFSSYYGISKDKFVKIPNGVDKSVFYPGDYARNRNLFLMASAPIKGMYPVTFTWYNLKRNNPDAELRLYCSQKLHDQEELKSTEALIKSLRKQGVNILKPVSQPELAETMRQAWAFLMPNHYPEICSNVLLQARACGLPVIATDIGSANEFIENNVNGLLTKTVPHDMFWWHKDFAELVVNIYNDNGLHDRIAAESPKGVYSWEDIGEKWFELLKELKNGNECLQEIPESVHV